MKPVALAVLAIAMASLWRLALAQVTPVGQTPSLNWQSCEKPQFTTWFSNKDITPNLQCATLTVALDPFSKKSHQQPVILALTRYPASQPNAKNLVIIAGGPGETSLDGIDNVLSGNAPEADILHENFNLIGYAPRGVSPSKPRIHCNANLVDNQAFAKSCATLTGKNALPHLNSQTASEDLNAIRQALGDEKLNAIAYSYGTKVLALYTLHHPDKLRAGVFDGVVDIHQDMFTMLYDQEVGFQHSFERFVTYNQAQSTGFFHQNNVGDPTQQFHRLLQKLDRQPLKDMAGNPINAEAVLNLFNKKLIWQKLWADLNMMLGELNHGVTARYDYLMEYTDEKTNASTDNPSPFHSQNIQDTEKSPDTSYLMDVINCNDLAPMAISKLSVSERNAYQQHYIRQQLKIDNASPYNNYKQKPKKSYLDTCYFWGQKGSDNPSVQPLPDGLPSLLFIAERYDPTTPHHNAVAMASYFHSPLITRDSDGHVASFNEHHDHCVNRYVIDYLLEPKKPIADNTCAVQQAITEDN